MKRTAAENDEIAYAFASHGTNRQQSQQRRLMYAIAITNDSAIRTTTAISRAHQLHERHFREKRVVTEAGLQLDVNDLKAQIAHLQLTQSLLTSRVLMRRDDSTGSLVNIVRTYYELFRNGYAPPSPTVNSETSTSRAISPKLKRQRYVASSPPVSSQNNSVNTTRQVAFLQAMLSPTMDTDGGCNGTGFNRKLRLWRRYTVLFALHDFRMNTCDVVTADRVTIVRTRGEFSMRVTQVTIGELFPHILRSSNKLQRQRLLDKVMGRELTCPCAIDLYFDDQGRVVRYDEATDFVRAFSVVVRDPRDLVTLFHGAALWEARLVGSRESNGDCTSSSSSPGSSPTSSTALGSGNEATSEGQRNAKRGWKHSISFLLNHEALLGKKSEFTQERLLNL